MFLSFAFEFYSTVSMYAVFLSLAMKALELKVCSEMILLFLSGNTMPFKEKQTNFYFFLW